MGEKAEPDSKPAFQSWRPGWGDGVKSFLTGTNFQAAAQLTCGVFIVALFSLVRAMSFPLACTAMTFFTIMSVLIPPDPHFGSKLFGSCLMVGSGGTGVVIGGALGSIAKSIDYNPYTGHDRSDFYDYTACYMVLSAVGLAFLVINRVGADPPYLWAVGMISCLAYGIVMNSGQLAPPPVPPEVDTFGNHIIWYWRQVVGRVLLDLVIAQGTAVLTGMLVLPTYASVDCRACVAKALVGIGQSVSKYSSKLLEPEDPYCLYVPPKGKSAANLTAQAAPGAVIGTAYDSSGGNTPLAKALSGADMDLMLGGGAVLEDEEVDDETILKVFRELATPPPVGPKAGSPPPPSTVLKLGPPVASYRALLGRARALMPMGMIEPPFITRYTFHSDAWGRVMGACEVLLTRVAGLEVVVEERRQVLGESSMECFFTTNLVPNLRLVFAEVATTCATLSRTLDPSTPQGVRPVGGCMKMFGRSWHDTRKQLQDAMADAVRGYLRRVHSTLKGIQAAQPTLDKQGSKARAVHIMDSTRMRGIMYTFSLTLGIIDAMEDLEQAVHALVIKTKGGATTTTTAPTTPADGAGAAVSKAHSTVSKAHSTESASSGDGAGKEELSGPFDKTDVEKGKPGGPDGVAQPPAPAAANGPPAAGGGAGAHAHAPPPPQILWLIMAGTLQLGVPLWSGLVHWLRVDLPSVFKPGGFKAAVRSRAFQVYCKYYACLLLIMMLIQGLSARADTDNVRLYKPGVAFTAAALSMSEKVESTVSKAVLWMVSTVVGGTLGFVTMVSPELATNPYGIMAIVCTFTFLVGTTAGHQYKVLIVLSLMTFNDVIVCQYTGFPPGCTDCHGGTNVYGARVLAVLMGALVPLFIGNLVLPWYNSEWCLETMGSAFGEVHKVLTSAYDQYLREGQQALDKSQAALSVTSSVLTADGSRREMQVRGQDKAWEEGADIKADEPTVSGPVVLGMPVGPPLSALQGKIVAPLVKVQISLVMDAAVWQAGILSTPPIVPRLLQQLYALLDRLAAVVVTLRPGTITGTFSGSAFKNIALPFHKQFTVVIDVLGGVVRASQRLMAGDRSAEAREELRTAVAALEVERLKARSIIISHRRTFHHSLASMDADSLPYMADPDDLVRVLSFMHAFIKLLDKATQVAGLASTLTEDCRPTLGLLTRDWLR